MAGGARGTTTEKGMTNGIREGLTGITDPTDAKATATKAPARSNTGVCRPAWQ